MTDNDSPATPKTSPPENLEPPISGMKGRAHELYRSRIFPSPAISPRTRVQRSSQRVSCSNISNLEQRPAHSGRSGSSTSKRYSTSSFGAGTHRHGAHQFVLPQSIPEVGQLNQKGYQQQAFSRRMSYMGNTFPEPMPTFRRHSNAAPNFPRSQSQQVMNPNLERPPTSGSHPRRLSNASMSSLKSMESSALSLSPRTADTSSLMSVEDRFVPKHWHPKSTEKLYALARRSESMVSLSSMTRSADLHEYYQQSQKPSMSGRQFNHGIPRNMQQPVHGAGSSYSLRSNQRQSLQLPRNESFAYPLPRHTSMQSPMYGSMQVRDQNYDRSRRSLQNWASASQHHTSYTQNIHTKEHQPIPNYNSARLLNNARMSYTGPVARTEPIKAASKFKPQFKRNFTLGEPSNSAVTTSNDDQPKTDDQLKREGSLKRPKTAISEAQQRPTKLKHSEASTSLGLGITHPPEPPATAGTSSTSSMTSPSSSTSIQPSTTSLSSSHTTDSSSNPVGTNSVLMSTKGKLVNEVVGALEHTGIKADGAEQKSQFLPANHRRRSHQKKSSSSSLKSFFKKFFRSSKASEEDESRDGKPVHSSVPLSTVS